MASNTEIVAQTEEVASRWKQYLTFAIVTYLVVKVVRPLPFVRPGRPYKMLQVLMTAYSSSTHSFSRQSAIFQDLGIVGSREHRSNMRPISVVGQLLSPECLRPTDLRSS